MTMTVHHTADCGTDRSYILRRIQTSSIRFRVKAGNDVSVCLSPDGQEQSEDMYEVFIGGWGGSKSAIRRKKDEDVVKVETPDIVSADEMRGFWIKISHGVIKVGREGERQPFMKYTDSETLLHVTHYGFCTAYGSVGYWTFSDDKEDGASSSNSSGISSPDSEADDLDSLEEKIHHTEDCGTDRCYNFRRIQTNSISFHVKAGNDVSICLCPDGQEQPEDMYEVFIGGWGGSKSAIRRKKDEDVVKVETPDIVSADEMRGFWIKISHGVIKVGREGECQPFMSYTDPETSLNVTHYGFCTAYGSVGYWTFSDDKEDGASSSKSSGISLSDSEAEEREVLEEKSKKMVLLRGYLHVKLLEAKDLPDHDTALFNIVPKDISDPFAQVRIGACVLCKTFYVNNSSSPKWLESFKVPICHESDEVHIEVLDKDYFTEGVIGGMSLRAEDLLDGEELEGWYPLNGCNGQIKISLNYVPKEDLNEVFEVPDCYFPLREGCRLKLYQDAHCPPLPIYENVPSDTGDVYDAPCAWDDLSQDLNNAQKFIYITGWSVWTECKLKRHGHDAGCDENDGPVETIGELLKRKAEGGVRVLVMVWDEKSSTEFMTGLMGTHDEDTRAYFEDTEVEVAKVPRVSLSAGITSYLEDQFSQTCYSHHQKTIIMDMPAIDGAEAQPILAYIGGLDLTDGRWDTPDHVLFKSLLDNHKEDFYNGCVTTTPELGPRQPWHDIHARVEGPVAKDVLDNFTERWRNQVKDKESRLLQMGDEFDLSAPAAVEEGNGWNAQLFRSITSDSATFDFDRQHYVPKRKGKYVDDSIHRAYIHHIRRADRFMFFENQYFLGSAYNWGDKASTKAHHLIPQEITHRICEKISAGEHIVAYIVIPMHPEGDPTSCAVQEILHWQHLTMEMMYKQIATTIQENELETKPTDYLTFFCLGKGETPDDIPEDLPLPDPDTPGARLREMARFMIYVHSKMMIIDDDYILVGSANINQRSMGGPRDSEIAVGAYQPMHTRELVGGDPRGSVHQFRMALWAEHLGGVEEMHSNPGTLECVQAVNELATTNWEDFVTEEPCHIKGHLLRYPLTVNGDGSVTTLEDFPNFPDTEAPILGAPNFLPNKLTT